MTKTDHYLILLAEVCAEIQKICCKALRFGLDDTNPATKKTNLFELKQEVNDLLAVIKLLEIEEDVFAQQQKMAKVYYWMNYSKERGKLNNE